MRWTLSVPGGIAELDTTADGGLAMFGTDGLLQVVGLSSGRPRWGRPAGFPSLPAAAGMQSAMAVTTGMVILGMNGHLTGYDDRTGRVRWTEALRPAQLATGVGELGLLASASLVYLTGVQQRTVEQWTPAVRSRPGHRKGALASGHQLPGRGDPPPASSPQPATTGKTRSACATRCLGRFAGRSRMLVHSATLTYGCA